MKTIELNEQQVELLVDLLYPVIGEDKYSNTYLQVVQQIISKLENDG